MNNFSIESDNCYVKKVIQNIINDSFILTCRGGSVSIFFFEKKCISRSEFYCLLMCPSNRALVIASDTVLKFVEKNILIKNIFFLSSKASFNIIKTGLEHFLSGFSSGLLQYPENSNDIYKLGGKATRIISKYLSGVPMSTMSKLERINIKTLYAYKNNVMAKKGLISSLSLVNHWEMVCLAEIYQG